jgi:glycosyltransferase involved in cell wall biosynthesis
MMDRPLRILLVADYPNDPRLGSAKVAHKLREELTSLGHQCDALFSDAIGATPRSRRVRQLVAPWLAGRAIARAVSSTPYDVVDASSAEGLWFGIQKRAGRFRQTAYICRTHGLEHLNYQRMLDDARNGLTSKPWTRRIWYPASRLSQVAAAARLSDRFIVLNAVDRDFACARRWLPPHRIDLVPHGVSDRFLAKPAVESRGAGVLFCGTWDHVKGVSDLVAAWTMLHDSGSQVPLTVLGPGIPPAAVQQAFPERVRPLVTVIERAPEDRVVEEYQRHDALVFTSTYEGFGLVVLEALSQGLAVIATPVGCAADLVADGVTGIRIPPRDPQAIVRAVRAVMTDAALRDRLGAAGAAAVRAMTWRATAEKTVTVYRHALAAGR